MPNLHAGKRRCQRLNASMPQSLNVALDPQKAEMHISVNFRENFDKK